MMEHIGLDEGAIHALADSYEERSPQDVLNWALERFGSRMAICTSFQADGMALLDMAWRIDPRSGCSPSIPGGCRRTPTT